MMMLVAWQARRRGFPTEQRVVGVALLWATLRGMGPLLMPVILLGSIYGGVTTPTEAAAVAATYALLLAMVGYQALNLGGLYRLLADSARATTAVATIVAGAFIFNFMVANEGVPATLAEWLSEIEMSPVVFIIAVNLIFLFLGAFLETLTLLLILVPLLIPTVNALGIDRVHFGVVIVVNMMLGLITPPLGVMLFVINGLTRIPLSAIVRELWPFLAILIAALFAMALIPEIVLWMPRQFGYRG